MSRRSFSFICLRITKMLSSFLLFSSLVYITYLSCPFSSWTGYGSGSKGAPTVVLAKKAKASIDDAWDDIQILGKGDSIGEDGKKKKAAQKISKEQQEVIDKLSKQAGHTSNDKLFGETKVKEEIEKSKKEYEKYSSKSKKNEEKDKTKAEEKAKEKAKAEETKKKKEAEKEKRRKEREGLVKKVTVEDMKKLQNSDEHWILNYYVPTCEHCNFLTKELEKLAYELKNYNIKMGTVDLTERAMQKASGISTLPALMQYSGLPEKNPYTKKYTRTPTAFRFEQEGLPTVRNIKNFITEGYPNHIVKPSNLTAFKKVCEENWKVNRPVVLIFTDKDKQSLLLKSIAFETREYFPVIEIFIGESFNQIIMDELEISDEDIPSIVVYNSPKDVEHYEGNIKDGKEIFNFLEGFQNEENKIQATDVNGDAGSDEEEKEGDSRSSNGSGKQKKKSKKAPIRNTVASLPNLPQYRELDDVADLEETVFQVENQAFVIYFDPNPKPKQTNDDINDEDDTEVSESILEKQWLDIANFPEAHVFPHRFFCEDSEESRKFCKKIDKLGCTGSGPFKVFGYGLTKDEKEEEILCFESPTEAMKEAGKSLPVEDVLIVEDFMVESVVQQAEQMNKIILFATSTKDEPSTLSKSIQQSFGDIILVTHISSPGPEFLAQLGTPRVPGYALFIRMQTMEDGQGQYQVINYNPIQFGPIKYPSLSAFVFNAIIQQAPDRREDMMKLMGTDSTGQTSTSQPNKQGKKKNLVRLEKSEDVEKYCNPNSATICVMFFLETDIDDIKVDPSTLSSKESNEISTMKAIQSSEILSAAPLQFVFLKGSCYPQFASSFDVDVLQIPTLVVYSPKKSRFVRYIGNFSPDPMVSFISGVLRGSPPTAPLAITPLTFDDDDTNIEICLSTTDSVPEFVDDSEEDEDFYVMMEEIRQEEERAKKERAEEVKREAEERKIQEAEAAKQGKKTKKKKSTKKKKKAKAKDEL